MASLARIVLLLSLVAGVCNAFVATSKSFKCSKLITKQRLQSSTTQLNAHFNPMTFLVAGGLDAETLGALGDVEELNEALDNAIDASNPALNMLANVVSSPAVLVVPILAGVLVAFGIGYFIVSYGQGRDD